MATKKENTMSKQVLGKIRDIAKGMYDTIRLQKKPEIEMPIRALSNVSYIVFILDRGLG